MGSKRIDQPTFILGDESMHIPNHDATAHNIQATQALADAIRSTLGPRGMDKMLVNELGDVTITNDGMTILREMDITDPVADMITSVAMTQENEVGDGTTTAVAIAGELLRTAGELLGLGIHPTSIIRGFIMAHDWAQEELEGIAEPIDVDDEVLLRQVAETSLTGKSAEGGKEHLAELAVDAVQRVTVSAEGGGNIVDLRSIDTETQVGPSISESTLVHGAVLDADLVDDGALRAVENARILLLDRALGHEPSRHDIGVDLDDPDQRQRFFEHEESEMHEIVERIVETGANVVLCRQEISELARHYLAQADILVIEEIDSNDLPFLVEVLEAQAVSHLAAVDSDDLGHGSIRLDDTRELLFVEGHTDESHGVTIVVRGPTAHIADEIERSVIDALEVVGQVVADERVLAGGGAIEMELASRLRDFIDGVEGREQLAVEAFTESLEVIPCVLAESAGLDPIDAMVDMRVAHEKDGVHDGIDVFTGEIVNTFETGVIESVALKQQAISSATEAANRIIKIDDIVAAKELSIAPEQDIHPDVASRGPGDVPEEGWGGGTSLLEADF